MDGATFQRVFDDPAAVEALLSQPQEPAAVEPPREEPEVES